MFFFFPFSLFRTLEPWKTRWKRKLPLTAVSHLYRTAVPVFPYRWRTILSHFSLWQLWFRRLASGQPSFSGASQSKRHLLCSYPVVSFNKWEGCIFKSCKKKKKRQLYIEQHFRMHLKTWWGKVPFKTCKSRYILQCFSNLPAFLVSFFSSFFFFFASRVSLEGIYRWCTYQSIWRVLL